MNQNHQQHIYDLCKDHMHAYVLAKMDDGTSVDGIVTGLDETNVYLAVPIEQCNCNGQGQTGSRQFGYGYGYPGYGYPYPGYYPPRRFRRLILPLAALTALSILPWY